jgi:hypothetical protein
VDVCHRAHDVIGHGCDVIARMILMHAVVHVWRMVSDVLERPMGHMWVVHGGWGVSHVGSVNAIIILYKSENKYAITHTVYTQLSKEANLLKKC